eukprot:gene54703-73091_t
MPDEDLGADFYELTQELTRNAGLPAYEISNHARPGQESIHNLIYWRYGEYAGIGPGAHGRLLIDGKRHATAAEKLPFEWQKQVAARGNGMTTDDVLTWEEEGDELLVMGLRLREGIDPGRFAKLSGRKIEQRQIDELKRIGFVETLPNGNLRVTDKGWPVLDAVTKQSVTAFLHDLEHPRKAEIERLREIIFEADPALRDQIKWNAPSFGIDGEDRITFRLQPGDKLDLIFHRGAEVKDSADFNFTDDDELVTWLSPDRGIIRFGDAADIEAK